MTHTLDIFERMVADLPPRVPEAIADEAARALSQMRENQHLTLAEAEDVIVSVGKKLWPYRQAFYEMAEAEEGKLGERLLLGKLVPEGKQRYREFKEYGGTYRDLHSGSPAGFFTGEERAALCASLVDVHRDIAAHTRQAVCSTISRRYEERVVEFQTLLDDVEKRLDTLRAMADDETAHPELAAEIRSQVHGFEHGLCLLGPRIDYAAVCNAAGHFEGRKMEKKMRV